MKIGNKEFVIGERTYVMGILNVTPDSFSDGGKFSSLENALAHARVMIEEGVDIIDIGGESTRPNHTAVSEEEEINRVIPIIETIRRESDIPISIDTYKGRVAEHAIMSGASLINDVWGFKKDPYISEVAAKYGVPCCLMHNRDNINYNNLMNDILGDLKECIQIALMAGVKRENIILDPGIGFGKNLEQNLKVMNNLHRFKELDLPLLLGTSRKSMIGNTLNLPADERVEGTIATSVIGVLNGFDFIRIHDVKENLRAIKMTEAIAKAGV